MASSSCARIQSTWIIGRELLQDTLTTRSLLFRGSVIRFCARSSLSNVCVVCVCCVCVCMPAGAGLSAGTHRKPASSTRRSAATRMSAGARAVASTWLRVTVREGLGEMGYAFRRRREADALVWRSSWATSAEPIHKFWLILVRSRRLQFQGMRAPLNCSL